MLGFDRGFRLWLHEEAYEVDVRVNFALIYSSKTLIWTFRWSPGKNPTNTVHVVDVAGAALALARWLAPLGRKEADKLAGESIPFHNDKSKVKGMEDAVPYNQKVVAPLFNLVGDPVN